MTYSRATGSENYWLPSVCRFRSVAGSGVLLVTEESVVPILKGKKPASNPVLTTGLPVTENCQLQSVAGSGTRMLLVTKKSAVNILTGKEPASNPVLTTGSMVTEVSRLQRIYGDKLVGQEVFFSKIP